MSLDNRELAALIWLAIAGSAILSKSELRRGFAAVLRIAINPLLVLPLLVMVGYIAIEIWAGWQLGLWNTALAKGTLIWMVGTALVLYFTSTKIADDPQFFRKTLVTTVAVTVFVEFFLNMFVFSFFVEFLLQPVLVGITLLIAVAETTPEHQRVKVFLERLLAVIGFIVFGYVLRQLYLHWHTLDVAPLLLELILPIWLTIGLLPFLYLLSLFVVYDSALRGINWATSGRGARWRARFALATALHLRHRAVRAFTWNWAKRLSETHTFHHARQIVNEFRRELHEKERAIAEEQDRLRRYAGSNETDSDGRRLDRREFKETIDALRWVETFHTAWHRNHGGRFRGDILTIIGNDFSTSGLPRQHGIIVTVAKDGQSWYAWRRTITGWCFAIGGVAPSFETWEYDGPDPPRGFPGKDRFWGARPTGGEFNRNWR